jgi:hypothetical protein
MFRIVLHTILTVDRAVVEVGRCMALRRCFVKYRGSAQEFFLKPVTSDMMNGLM